MEHSLLCDEQWLASPISHCQTPTEPPLANAAAAVGGSFYSTKEDRDHALAVCLQKEASYLLEHGYAQHLCSSDLIYPRFKAVQLIIKTQSRLNLSIGSVFDAVNYLDRYISANRCMKWEYRMFELLSIACLSIASKCNEVSIPSLLQFQGEDLDRSFQSDEIQQMELTVLKALGWRLSCVTPNSYVDLMTWQLQPHHPHAHVALTARMTELLLTSLTDPKLIEFRPCTLAASALRCGLEELLPLKSNVHFSDIVCLLPRDQMGEVNKCHMIMEEHIADPQSNSPAAGSSPVSVMESERMDDMCDCCCDITLFSSNNGRKRKREAMARLILEDHGRPHFTITPPQGMVL